MIHPFRPRGKTMLTELGVGSGQWAVDKFLCIYIPPPTLKGGPWGQGPDMFKCWCNPIIGKGLITVWLIFEYCASSTENYRTKPTITTKNLPFQFLYRNKVRPSPQTSSLTWNVLKPKGISKLSSTTKNQVYSQIQLHLFSVYSLLFILVVMVVMALKAKNSSLPLKASKTHPCVYMADVHDATTAAFVPRYKLQYLQEESLDVGSTGCSLLLLSFGSPVEVNWYVLTWIVLDELIT